MQDIIISNLNKSYGDKRVLTDLSFTIPAEKITALMAPSGRGKTTLIRILLGLANADSGSISGIEGIKRSVVFQEDRLIDEVSAIANIRMVVPHKSDEEIKADLNRVGLTDCGGIKVSEFSGGMKRRVAIVRAMMAESELLILDEPFKGLDEDTKQRTIEYVKEGSAGKTVIFITHEAKEADMIGADIVFNF